MTANFEQLMSIFQEALEKHPPEEWDAFIRRASRDDDELYRQVSRILEAHVRRDSLLDRPAVSPAYTLDQPIAEKPGTIIGPYKLLQEIGEGGMGVVYMAEQTEPVERRVALKIIKPGMDTRQVIARFQAEEQALAMMDHPNIAKVLDAGATDTGRPYFVMELVKGVPITQYCDERHLTPRQRLELFVSVCHAIQHAHQKGIIHRDIKPTNVLVAEYDDRPVPKIIDFGVAKAIDQRLTEKSMFTALGQVVGTIDYMSPEQAKLNQLDIDTRSDIYSLGVLLYELLTGETPLDHQRLHSAAFDEMLRIIREEEPPRPSLRLSSSESLPSIAANRQIEPKKLSTLVRGELDWIVMKALEKDRNRRYETANALAHDLENYLHDEPVLACPPSMAYRLRKFTRRNKGPVLAVTLVLLALLAGTIGTTWGLIRADRARQAEAERAEGERHATDEARVREAETRAVLDFVENKVFAAARPEGEEGGLGHDVTLRAAVEAALPFVETSFTDQPLIEAQLRMTLGRSFLHLGEAKVAAAQYQTAQTIYTQHRGLDHVDTLVSMNGVARAYLALGRYSDALKLHEETLARCKTKLGRDHPHTLRCMNGTATTYFLLARYVEALRLHEEALELCKATLGPRHPQTLGTMNDLACDYSALGLNTEASKLREETLAVLRTTLGPHHPQTLAGSYNLALSYAMVGRDTDALRLCVETLTLQKAKLGPLHPDTLKTMNGLANTYLTLGRDTDALKLMEETLALRKAKHGPDHPETFSSMNDLANCYARIGRDADALKLREEVLSLLKVKRGPGHPSTLTAMNNLAVSYLRSDRHADALCLLKETLTFQEVKFGPDHAETLRSMYNIAACYSALGRHDDALQLHQDVLTRRRANLGTDHRETRLSMCQVAASLFVLNRRTEARRILNDCLDWAVGKPLDTALASNLTWLAVWRCDMTKGAAGWREAAEKCEKLNPADGKSRYNIACARAITATILRSRDKSEAAAKEAAAEADRAMLWLKQAVAAGYRNAEGMKKDIHLNSLRDREDFKKLLADLETDTGERKK